MDKTPMTVAGHRFMQDELTRLKGPERIRIAKSIEEAREHGDLSENAEYDAAKNAQGLLEAKIRDLESKLSRAQVIDISTLSGSKVIFGATVGLIEADSGEARTIKIVGEDESDVVQGRVSFSSPLARALIGKNLDDLVRVETPSGAKEYEIVKVEFGD